MSTDEITSATVDDAGELLTLQRAAYVSEARLYETPSSCPGPVIPLILSR